MDKNMTIKVVNRGMSRVGYSIPELGVVRQFTGKEAKEITFGELEALSFIPGGMPLITDYLIVRSEEALKELGVAVEPEYFYSEAEIKKILLYGSMDEFLDCLDFAPAGVLDMLKDMAVDLPLNDMAKREAILNKLNFNVTNAINIKNTKFDGEEEKSTEEKATGRRVKPAGAPAETGRRTNVPQYKVVSTIE